jgi:hypothetical protein
VFFLNTQVSIGQVKRDISELVNRVSYGGERIILTSAISKTVHFEQITEAEGRQALEQLAALGVQLFTPNLEHNQAAFDWTVRLKRAADYDSYYLALAQNLDCPFWTADSRLYHALKGERLSWLHWIEEMTPLT